MFSDFCPGRHHHDDEFPRKWTPTVCSRLAVDGHRRRHFDVGVVEVGELLLPVRSSNSRKTVRTSRCRRGVSRRTSSRRRGGASTGAWVPAGPPPPRRARRSRRRTRCRWCAVFRAAARSAEIRLSPSLSNARRSSFRAHAGPRPAAGPKSPGPPGLPRRPARNPRWNAVLLRRRRVCPSRRLAAANTPPLMAVTSTRE